MGRILGIVIVILASLSSHLAAQPTATEVEAGRTLLVQGGWWRTQHARADGGPLDDSLFWRFTPTHVLVKGIAYTQSRSGQIVVHRIWRRWIPYTLRRPTALDFWGEGEYLLLCLPATERTRIRTGSRTTCTKADISASDLTVNNTLFFVAEGTPSLEERNDAVARQQAAAQRAQEVQDSITRAAYLAEQTAAAVAAGEQIGPPPQLTLEALQRIGTVEYAPDYAALVLDVQPGPAATALQLQPGDHILMVGGRSIDGSWGRWVLVPGDVELVARRGNHALYQRNDRTLFRHLVLLP